MDKKILIVDDEKPIVDVLKFNLEKDGYETMEAYDGESAVQMALANNPDLIILDVMLPGIDGFTVCKKLRQRLTCPIIMLTARNDVFDKVLGLELGADDYITKPFHIKEVLTRVKIALRRIEKYSEQSKTGFINLNSYVKINYDSRSVIKSNKEVTLKPKEYQLLEFLSQNRDRVFSREELLDNVWEFTYDGDLRTIDIHVRRLRSKLDEEKSKSIIETVFGVGYVMRRFNENKV